MSSYCAGGSVPLRQEDSGRRANLPTRSVTKRASIIFYLFLVEDENVASVEVKDARNYMDVQIMTGEKVSLEKLKQAEVRADQKLKQSIKKKLLILSFR